MKDFAPAIEAARARLRAAQADGASVLPCGRRTRMARHAPDAAADVWLELGGLDGLVWLDAADQTCEVGAGTAPAALDAALAAHGLMLAVDAPEAARGTLGGLFLAPDLSLLHGAYGPPRDQVLGGRWLLADGAVVRTGARVVKSVAGYDLTRLFLGSRGRLAACLTLTLRLQPRPRNLRAFRVQDPAGLRAGGLPDPCWFFQARAGAAWAAWDGIEPRDPRLTPCPRDEFEAARAECLTAFAALPARIALAAPPASAPAGPCDWLTLQIGCSVDAPVPEAAGRIPPPAESAWLARVAGAVAADGARFGQRAASVVRT